MAGRVSSRNVRRTFAAVSLGRVGPGRAYVVPGVFGGAELSVTTAAGLAVEPLTAKHVHAETISFDATLRLDRELGSRDLGVGVGQLVEFRFNLNGEVP